MPIYITMGQTQEGIFQTRNADSVYFFSNGLDKKMPISYNGEAMDDLIKRICIELDGIDWESTLIAEEIRLCNNSGELSQEKLVITLANLKLISKMMENVKFGIDS